MRFKTRWATLPPIFIFSMLMLVLACVAILPQLLAVAVTAPERLAEGSGLGLGAIVMLWTELDPTIITEAAVPGFVHWLLVAAPFVLVIVLAIFYLKFNASNKKNPQLRKGLAKPSEVKKMLSKKAVLEEGKKLRERLAKKRELKATDCGYRVGTYWDKELWVRVEDPMIVLGPPRSGKGLNIVLNWIVNAPGAVITTSSKPDNLFFTLEARKLNEQGDPRDVWVFAPGIKDIEKIGHTLRWNPIDGCIEETTLLRRIKGLIPDGAFGGSTSNGGHWDTLGQQLAAHLFHAAACADGDVDLIWSWVVSPQKALEAVKIIREHPQGLIEHASHLEQIINMPPEQRASSWGTLATVLAFLESKSAREWLKPDPNVTQNWHPVKFVMRRETLYLIGGKTEAPAYKVIIEGLLAELDYETSSIARSQGGRLDPPVTYLLDEAANFSYPGLEQLLSDGGGQGRIGVPVFQSKAQLRSYGENAEQTLWDSAIVKLVLPGTSDPKTLDEINVLMGEVETYRESHNFGQGPLSINVSEQKESAFDKNEIREMEKKFCIFFYRNMKPIVAKMIPFYEQPKYKQYKKDALAVEARLNKGSEYTSRINEFEDARN